jgi:alkylation response protein AidB-like acyl-CoA dehydrogenase
MAPATAAKSNQIHHNEEERFPYFLVHSVATMMLAARRVLPRIARRYAARAYTSHSQLPEEHRMIYEMCSKFADEELIPNAREWDQKHEYPAEAVAKLVSFQLTLLR